MISTFVASSPLCLALTLAGDQTDLTGRINRITVGAVAARMLIDTSSAGYDYTAIPAVG